MKAVPTDPAAMARLVEDPAAPWNRPEPPPRPRLLPSVGINPRRCLFCPEVIYSEAIREEHVRRRHSR